MDGGSKPIYISFKGIKTFSEDPSKARIVYFDLKRDEGYETLVNVTSLIISEFLDK